MHKDTAQWRSFSAVAMAITAERYTTPEGCPFPVGYGLDSKARIELPGSGSTPISVGDWLVSFAPGQVTVVGDAAFRELVGAEQYARATAAPGLKVDEAAEAKRAAQEEVVPHVSNKSTSKAGIERSEGQSTRGQLP